MDIKEDSIAKAKRTLARMTEAALQHLAQGRTVVGAFDNDRSGETLHRKLLGFLPEAKRLAPPSQIQGSGRTCKDWLDVLAARKVMAMDPGSAPSNREAPPYASFSTEIPVEFEDPRPS